MHRNPLLRKLVTHAQEWPWSSWSHLRKGGEGLTRIDRSGGGSSKHRNDLEGNVKDRTLNPEGCGTQSCFCASTSVIAELIESLRHPPTGTPLTSNGAAPSGIKRRSPTLCQPRKG